MNRENSVMSYIILGRPGEALRPFATNGLNFLSNKQKFKT